MDKKLKTKESKMSTKRERIERELEQREVELETLCNGELTMPMDHAEEWLEGEIERLKRELAKLRKTAPEGTGNHLKDALRDQRGQIESEFVVYGFCVLLFLGILISGLCGKYDANPEEAQKQLQEQRDKGIFIKVGDTRGGGKYRQISQNKQAKWEDVLERERCFAFYMIMVRNKYLTLDAAKEALKSGKDCGNYSKI